jgi:hypothetical protein
MNRTTANQGFMYRTILPMAGAFALYCSMYAFRKPFTAGVFEGLALWGIDYKILLISVQALGYMLSKFMGIKIVSEMSPQKRAFAILGLIGLSWASLLLFAVVPYPYHSAFLFLNGLPLGMIWGLVFSYLEGRRNTELLGAGMSASFIVSSGLVKSLGRYLMDTWQVSEFWMPFLTGLLFVPTLLVGLWMLENTPPPDEADIAHRSERSRMDGNRRIAFFRSFSAGIVLVTIIYITLTIFRDVRDNFAVEIWTQLGHTDVARMLFWSEVPIAIVVFVIIALMMYIRNNRMAFYSNIAIIVLGGALLCGTTYLFETGVLGSLAWMVLIGFSMYLSYISYHTMLFERWFAHFRCAGNLGFLMYLSDSFGYLGSLGVLFYKNFGEASTGWLQYLQALSYGVGAAAVLFGLLAWAYFRSKEHIGLTIKLEEDDFKPLQ